MSASIRSFWCTAAAACVLATALSQEVQARDMYNSEKRLLADLKKQPAFMRKIPTTNEIVRLEFAGSFFPGDLIYGQAPGEIAVVPRALTNRLARNCLWDVTTTEGGSIVGSFTNSASFTVTHGWEVGGEVSFKAGWPAAETQWTISAKYSGSKANTTAESESWAVEQNWSAPVLPRTEFDIQMQVIQQEIEGQSYELDLMSRGKANIYHRPKLNWVASRGTVPKNAINGGGETSPTTGKHRNLPICRAQHGVTKHPGKVVAGRCNISYGGKEHEKTRFEVLTGKADRVGWEKKSRGETNKDKGVVAGQESRKDKHDGKLYVCRAEYKGGVHPGKLVINDCMFGYGGKEIEINKYEILTYDSAEEKSAVLIEDFLSEQQRTFRIEGSFQGVVALNTTTVYSPSRPVSELGCPGGQVAQAAAAPETQVARAPAKEPGGAVFAAKQARAASMRQAQAPTELALLPEATEFLRVELGAGDAAKAKLISRRLRLEEPALFGPDVLAAQLALKEAGWPLHADGFFGPRTDRALRLFQRANDLREDGIFGPVTQKRLGL